MMSNEIRLKTACAWCGRWLNDDGTVGVTATVSEIESHGICLKCKAELQRERAGVKWRDIATV